MKRLLFRLLLTASLLTAPLFGLSRLPLLHFLFDDTSTGAEATCDASADDAQWEAAGCREDARPVSRVRFRAGRRGGKVLPFDPQSPEWSGPSRFALVVDVRRIKPKQLFAPPYLRPRVVRLLS